MRKLPQYWIEKDRQDLKTAETYADLRDIAMRILKRMPRPIAEVCGPITTGGRGNIKDNMKVFDRAIRDLSYWGYIRIFNQLPFEAPMHKIMRRLAKASGKKYDKRILLDFYLPIFKSGLIEIFYFLPGWRTSFGARWEHRQAKKLGIKIVYLSSVFLPH